MNSAHECALSSRLVRMQQEQPGRFRDLHGFAALTRQGACEPAAAKTTL